MVEGPVVPGLRACSRAALVVRSWVMSFSSSVEPLIPFVGNLHLLDHSIMFSFEGCDLARESVICGCGVGQSLRLCREVNRHGHELCFRPLVLCGEAFVLGREFDVCLCCLFLVVAPCCLGSVELVGEFVASGLFNEQFLLEEVVGGRLARVGMEGAPHLGSQDLIPCRGLVLVNGGLLGLCMDLK